IYQVGDSHLATMHFFENVGQPLLGISTKAELARNPIAQELAGLMEFTGIPSMPGLNFVSKYTATRSDALRVNGLSNQNFDAMLGKTVTVKYRDLNGNEVGGETITFTKAGISAAAHLVGAGGMARAMSQIFSAAFNAQGQQIETSVTLSVQGFGDGNK